jgi:hypothetical protein
LSNYEISWTLSADGKPVQSGILNDFNLKPRESQVVKVPAKIIVGDPAEYFIDFSVKLKKPNLSCPQASKWLATSLNRESNLSAQNRKKNNFLHFG